MATVIVDLQHVTESRNIMTNKSLRGIFKNEVHYADLMTEIGSAGNDERS